MAQDAPRSAAGEPTPSPVDDTASTGNEVDSRPSVPADIRGMSGRIQYVGPDTYILLDAQGRPQPVPGLTYEDFMAAWKRLQQSATPNRQPRFTIESIQFDGQADEQRANLRFAATVHLLTDEPVQVPLGLVGAILDGQPQFGRAPPSAAGATSVSNGDATRGKPEDEYLDYDPERGGFVARLVGRAGERHIISVKLLVPLQRDGAETTLPLNCPRALSSNLNLQVDAPVTEVNVTNGTLLAQEATAGGGTRLEVAGLGGPWRLSWQTSETAGRLTTVLSAAGAIRVSIDGRSVQTDARLTVRSYGGSFDRFRVRLPRGAQLIQGPQAEPAGEDPGYRITLEEELPADRTADGAGDRHQVVLVELPEKQRGPVVVALSIEQPIGLENTDLAVELAGFEVLGAVRQFGDVALQVADDWQARWDIGRFVRQVDPSELDPVLRRPSLTAAFQYDRQPWALGVLVAARQFRLHVTPKYELECFPDEARLNVHITYQVLGARAFEFRVNLQGWELTADPVESSGLVDRDRILLTPDGTLVLPLVQASTRRAEIAFAVKRVVPRDARQVRLPLPTPVADSVGAGELAVRAPANIELLPDMASSIGLTPVAAALVATTSDDGRELRFRSFLPDAVFAADRVSRAREVSADLAAQVDIQETAAQIDQRVDYVVRYEPIKELVFEVPRELPLDEDPVEIVMLPPAGDGGEDAEPVEMPLSFVSPVEENNGSPAPAGTRQVRVALPQPRLGRFAVRIRYRVPRPKDLSANGVWQLPLLRPADGPVAVQRAAVSVPRSMAVGLDTNAAGSSWKSASAPAEASGPRSSYEFISDRWEASLPLILSAVDLARPSATAVERVWLQTWLSGDVQQDRATFRFRTAGPQVVVELPPQTLPGEIEVLVDGQTADVLSREAGRIIVRLVRASGDGEGAAELDLAPHTLELRCRRPTRRSFVTRHRLTPPQIVGTTTLTEVYWQVVLPGDQHVVQSPTQMTSASEWQWLGSFWGRRPIRSQAALEQWVGATNQLAPSAAQNEYLFTGLAPVSSIELVLAPRWLIVLASSSAVLTLVVAWIYVPLVRRRWLVIAAACLLAGPAAAFPSPALLLGQASLLGVVLAALALLIASLISRPMRLPTTLPASSFHRLTTPRPESLVMPPVAATASTAPTAPLRTPDAER